MRVQCEQCAATYSVADEKVAGRKLKQKCRKCGAPMLIDGTTLGGHDDTPMAVPSAPTSGHAPVDQPVWHIALGDTTQGPYTLEELAQHYADGNIVLDTLICRDGWNDWKPAGEVSELLEAARGPALHSVLPPAPAGLGAASLSQAVTMGRDPFGDSVIENGPRVSAQDALTQGGQHDGTVQFSMDQMRALSSVSAPSVPAPAPVSPGYAGGDDSGLIDMRALAEAEARAAAEAAQAALMPVIGEGGFRSLRTSEMGPMRGISPLSLGGGEPTAGLEFRTKVMASLAAFTAVVAAAVVIVVLLRDNKPVAAAAPPESAPLAIAAAAAAPLPTAALAAAVAPPSRAAAPAKASGANSANGDEDRADDDDGRSRGRRGGRHARRGGDDRPSAKSSDQGTDLDDVLAKADAPKKSSAGASIDDLLNGAINGKRSEPKEEAREPVSTVPKTASREDMFAALGRAKAKAAACKGGGVAMASITITGKSGKATSVSVTGVEGGAKSCVEKAVRSTSFPKFQNDSMKVQFPFKLGA